MSKTLFIFLFRYFGSIAGFPSIKEKHQQHIVWQIQQVEWMFNFNVDRNTFQQPQSEDQYKQLAYLFWMTMDNWMYSRQVKGFDHLNENDFIADLWCLMSPYLTEEAREELKMLSANSNLRFN